jgi:hypothetical protein
MSSYGKRSAVSPKENMPKKAQATKVSHETDPNTIVKVELESINEKPYFGQVSDDEILYIWCDVFKRSKDELFGTASTKTLTRNVRITFKLLAPIVITEFAKGPNFRYEKYHDDGVTDVITGRIIGYGNLRPVELGEVTKVTVKTNFGVEALGIVNWLKLYGTVAPQWGFTTNPNTGLKTDIFETEICLKKHIEEYLPIHGQKCQVNYPGIPRQCNRCYGVGHMRRECNNTKKDWIEYVRDLVAGGVKLEYVGTWSKAIERFENANLAACKEKN